MTDDALPFDQRGEPFGRVADGSGGGPRVDIGAYESQAVPVGFPEGDYNQDGIADAADYTVWRDTLGSTTDLRADGDGDLAIGIGDYLHWRQNFGATQLQFAPPFVTTPSDDDTLATAFVLLVSELEEEPSKEQFEPQPQAAAAVDDDLLLVLLDTAAEPRPESTSEAPATRADGPTTYGGDEPALAPPVLHPLV